MNRFLASPSLLAALLLAVLPACSTSSPVAEMATGLCECMAPLAQSIGQLDQTDELNETEALAAQIDTLMDAQVSPCLDALETRYADRLQAEEAAIRTEMQRQCPDVVRAMERASR